MYYTGMHIPMLFCTTYVPGSHMRIDGIIVKNESQSTSTHTTRRLHSTLVTADATHLALCVGQGAGQEH